MTKEEIIENNKLITEFMNYHNTKVTNDSSGLEVYRIMTGFNPKYGNNLFATFEKMPHHISWDFLMPVVEKIESLSYNKGRHYYIHITQSHVQFLIDRTNETPFSKWGSTNNKLQAIYKAVIQFIKWYNERKQ